MFRTTTLSTCVSSKLHCQPSDTVAVSRRKEMSEPIWNQFLTERDKAVFGPSGYGARAGFGKRPALLIIDVNYAFCGDKREPILESIKTWRNSCGEDAWDALPVLAKLIETARAREIPIIYTTG